MIKQFTKLLLGLVLLISAGATKAQINGYTFAASAGTYTDITGGTPVATTVSAADFLGDTKTSVNIPLGFSFVFNGTTYTQVRAMSDGYLSFNLTATSSLTNNLATGAASNRPLVAPLWDDLDGASGSGAANYITTGTAGSQVFTIEWKNWQWRYDAVGATISFQVKLYEGTNKIEFIYRQEAGALSSPSASIGIAGIGTGSGNFLSLNNATATPTASSTTETTSIATKPATGQVYAFTPPPPAAIDMTITAVSVPTTACNGNNFPVIVTIKNNGTDPINFATNNATIAVNVTGAATQSLTATVSTGTLAPGATQDVTVAPNANLSAPGSFTLTATVAVTGDANNTNNSSTATYASSGLVAAPWSEGFATTAVPAGWTTTGWIVGSARGVTGNPGNNIYKNLYSSATTGTFTTLRVGPIVSTNQLQFDYKVANYSSPYGVPADGWGSFKVQISTDCGTTFTIIDSVFTATAGWVTKTYPLSAYEGQNVIVRIKADWLAGDYDLAFDNFKIETPAACPAPNSINVGSITTNSASVSFTSTGNSFVLEYGATGFTPGTGATAGTGGTVITTTASPVAITGLLPNTTYQVYIRQNCTAAGNGYSTNSAAISFTTSPLCTTNISPVDRTTNVAIPFTLSWNAAAGATSYDVYFGTDPTALPNIGNVTGTSTSVTNTTYNTTYYWYVAPKNASGANTSCQSTTTRFTTSAPPPPPPNDLCANAATLAVSNGFCMNPVAGTLAGADSTAGLGAPSCAFAGTSQKYDVWYKLVVPSTGKVTIRTQAIKATSGNDLQIVAYTGACGTLTAVGCDEDGNPDVSATVSANSLHSWLGLTGQVPASTVYIRVTAYAASSLDSFSICAYDTTASVLPAVASGSANACVSGNAVTISQTNGNNYVWVPLMDASGNIIAELNANGNNLGSIASSFYKNTGAVRSSSAFYLDRNITITPANQPGANRPSVRLYFTTAELTAFAAAAGATTRAQLMITKNADPCSATFTQNGNVGLGAINASGAYGADNYIEDSVSSFSSFFIHRTGTALPITLEYLKGQKAATGNALNWKVNCTSVSITMQLERSSDSRSFTSITSITASQARCGQPFDYVDASPLKGTNYYRLKLIDVDGKVSYSPIVAIINGSTGAELVGIYPTVVRDEAFLSIAASRSTRMQFNITDMSGRVIKTISQTVANGSTLITINTTHLSAGMYNITGMLDGVQTKTLRFVKQ